MINGEELKELIANPEKAFMADRKSLSDRIEAQRLGTEEVKDAVAKTAKEKGKNLTTDFFDGKWGSLVLDIVDTGNKLKEKLNDAKKVKLFAEYLQKSDDQQLALEKLSDLVTSPYGVAIYSKISSILDSSSADEDLLQILSAYLAKVTDSEDIRKTFSRSKTVLNIISKCSPQALILIKNRQVWPVIPSNRSFAAVSGIVQGVSVAEVASEFAKVNVFSGISISSIQAAIVDMEFNGLAKLIYGNDATPGHDHNKEIMMEELTETGNFLLSELVS
ncbi:hypothetical protein LCAUCD174_2083 [Lacticaseibacillus paracasei]|uniref:hypothetical protein n=1 Tax=Lacticaseibacillus paracasei TaxID=1597 RepID=UPI0002984361|nr:hypothetical protein [Lacticaseibacillus paracasei]EKQ17897.1 hypothetical protein LCAUCD174_2083 [Lacticaseibacillus paracasei]